MKKIVCAILLCAISLTSFAQDIDDTKPPIRTGRAAAASSQNATMLSMVTWGVILTAGIVVLFVLLKNSSSSNAHSTTQ